MKLPLQGMAMGRVVAGRGGGGQSQVVQGGGRSPGIESDQPGSNAGPSTCWLPSGSHFLL